MDRRAFFSRGLRKATGEVVKHVDSKATKRAQQWLRPPFAIDELAFLLACTRCGDCVSACEYNVIFPLPSRLGTSVVNTPALDLLNRGCHLCDGWPCVTVCEPAALKLPLDEAEPEDASDESHGVTLPILARASIDTTACLPFMGPECGGCRDSCPVTGAMTWEMEKPSIHADHCTGCALCREACIVEPKAIIIQSVYKTI